MNAEIKHWMEMKFTHLGPTSIEWRVAVALKEQAGRIEALERQEEHAAHHMEKMSALIAERTRERDEGRFAAVQQARRIQSLERTQITPELRERILSILRPDNYGPEAMLLREIAATEESKPS